MGGMQIIDNVALDVVINLKNFPIYLMTLHHSLLFSVPLCAI
jgi:hypothetical protein